MKQLTKAEEEIMQVLWELEKTTVAAVIEKLPTPKPAYNTVSTIVRILENKGFVGHEKLGRGYLYFPLIKKADYSNQSINKLMEGYFQGSFKSMVSFFMKKNDMSLSELESILEDIKEDDKKE
ncbi:MULTISPECIES: BlaI/MecI/CopY family transcriptional regulator [Cellulophaga]|uniref:Transcriptional repressor, CopY family n=2 Tax=Cellulophaga TaxID=104264 RepID=F0RCZ2_CELLC|nr:MULTISPECIES: BlaI/MecI/CopY family transcriptional regulator [Cellulophaga]ADY28679.1 transcriptional repressor, CopY family [Cellulophaga lytica DSM 7489]AIM59727.1 CopY family transcriptional repressor [Cellulophaga lytica]APU09586.1 CopY family transcriptional repressor [Cellulophaga lytica]EWH13056.1 CopY family transcriptional repressor [Cellulophaga geojensis KL-A]MDO6853981.1 BlaI/MecI/CopY family transcriptional regulator [Cellulophaga lytica]